MRRRFALSSLCVAMLAVFGVTKLAASPGPGSAPPSSEAPPVGAGAVLDGDIRFGKVVRGEPIERTLTLRNVGTAPLRVSGLALTPPLTAAGMPAQVPPGGEATLRVRLDTSQLYGDYEGVVVVRVNDPARPELTARFEGRVVRSVEADPPLLALAATRGAPESMSTVVVNHEAEPVHIEGIDAPEGRLSSSLETLEPGRRYRLTVRLDAADTGRGVEHVTVRTTSARTPELRIPVHTYVHDPVYTFPAEVDMGDLALADLRADPALVSRVAQTLMVYQVGGSDFRASLASDLPFLDVRAEPGPKGDRYQATVGLKPGLLEPGPIRGTITIETNDPGFPRLTVPVRGAIVGG